MINVCEKCGVYQNDKIVDKMNNQIICPECGFIKKYIFLPLFMISGASGSGKSTICNYLVDKNEKYIVLDMDILWSNNFNKPENSYQDFFETWLRLAKNISQGGRPIVLFGAGCIPDNIKNCIEKKYFKKINYLALTCVPEILSKRLNERPKWRNSSNKDFIDRQMEYNNFLSKADIEKIETGNITIEEASNKISNWIENIIKK
jgi:dephospho-CoA kinase